MGRGSTISVFSTVAALAVAALIVVAPSSCRTVNHGVDWGWRAERPAEPADVFSHQTHRDVFGREQIQCFACHTMSARIVDKQEAATAIRASKDAFSWG